MSQADWEFSHLFAVDENGLQFHILVSPVSGIAFCGLNMESAYAQRQAPPRAEVCVNCIAAKELSDESQR
jgi:hypothetical protein